MRITFSSQYRDAAAGLATAAEQMLEMQRQVATGRRVNKPSDDPTSASAIVVERAQMASAEQYTRAANSMSARLNVTDTVLSGILEKLTSVQATAMSAQGATKTANEREAAAQKIEGLRTSLLADFNSTFHGTYIFAGAAATTQPFVEVAGVVGPYAGSTNEVAVDVGEQRSVTVGFNGDAIARGSEVDDIFAVLDDMAAAMRAADDAAISTASTAVARAFDRVTTAQTRVGVALNAIEQEQTRLQDLKLSTLERLSNHEDADMAEAITGMSRADAAYQAALGAIAKGSRASLMDYLG
jgi:flagellar hook-associated protein 3 FlgL